MVFLPIIDSEQKQLILALAFGISAVQLACVANIYVTWYYTFFWRLKRGSHLHVSKTVTLV